MILDTSALIAIFAGESEAVRFTRLILDAEYCLISAATYVEVPIVLIRQVGTEAGRYCDEFLEKARITIEPLSIEQGRLARQASLAFGKGRHPAALNFGDCFSYALAKSRNETLLFKGDDFRKTDIDPAL